MAESAQPFGAHPHHALKEFGIDDRRVTPVTARPAPVTCCEIVPPDGLPLCSYRQPKAPDLEIPTRGTGLLRRPGDPGAADHRHGTGPGARRGRSAGGSVETAAATAVGLL
ncbi:hypothetical protein [Streptomyces sediminimaris]|uniref:hypothetical protein n=1 Tax=Streptomyces sediminimaris TaxID=3383721 RepID=UPI0039995ECE